MLTIREYKQAASLEEAWQLNQKRPNKIIGGMLWLKMTRGNVMTAIDLSALGLDKITETETEFRIGCMTTLRQLEQHPGLAAYTGGAVREAVRHIVGVQFRNLATVGGSVFGRFGFSDVLTVLLALDSYVELYKGGVIPLAEFARMKYDRDVLVQIIVKKESGLRCAYKSARLTRTDFPMLTCAAAVSDNAGLRLAVGARPAKAMLLQDEKNLVTAPVTQEKTADFAAWAAENIPMESNPRGSAAYRRRLAQVLAQRALADIYGINGQEGNADAD